jgi:hypothetical protein
MTPRATHFTLEQILDGLRGKLPPERERSFQEHRTTCARCHRASAWLADLLALTARASLVEPPDEALEHAFDIVPAPRSESPRRAWGIAALLDDTFTRPALAGIRGQAGVERRVLFRAGSSDLDLEIAPSPEEPDALRVTGQVLTPGAPSPEGLVAMLRPGPGLALRALGDDLGVFVFPAVPPGRYRLDILAPGGEIAIRVQELELESP